ncbi:MAG TPA: sulfate/thiosulfate ABC transporter permease CysW, partial [Rhodocyclaceae bacterium]|nr:sulfate/thiosulfate ABC transporter permease CysW [Rhodocyclaceae bacterium]
MSGNQLTRATQEPAWVRYSLLTIGLGFLFFFLGLPLIAVFVEALAQGLPAYLEALKEPETRSAIWLTVVIALAVLPFNILFGVAAAWAIAKFEFKGKSLLIT